jgi:hypothetical protein
MKSVNMKGITMKSSTKKIFFGVVLVGGYHLGMAESVAVDEFKSLHERSPFGDAPKPEPKPPPQISAPKASVSAPPHPPKKPDMKLGCSGHMRVGGQDYFSIHDKTSKEAINTVLLSGKSSPLGYAPKKFDASKKTLEIEYDGHAYVCPIGEEEKKATGNNNADSFQTTHSNSSTNQSSYYPPSQGSVAPSYDFDDYWDWDYWDDLDYD